MLGCYTCDEKPFHCTSPQMHRLEWCHGLLKNLIDSKHLAIALLHFFLVSLENARTWTWCEPRCWPMQVFSLLCSPMLFMTSPYEACASISMFSIVQFLSIMCLIKCFWRFWLIFDDFGFFSCVTVKHCSFVSFCHEWLSLGYCWLEKC